MTKRNWVKSTEGNWVAPWGPWQIRALRWWQENLHPYTCGNQDLPNHPRDPLIPTADGWICNHCDYTQNWAIAFTPRAGLRDDGQV